MTDTFAPAWGWRETAVPRVLRPLLRADFVVSSALHRAYERSAVLALFFDLGSISIDEGWVFGLPVAIWLCTGLQRIVRDGWGNTGCSTASALIVFGSAVSCAILEILVKLLFQRGRPPWSRKQSQWILPGERFSFPSGHTLRAFFFCFVLADSVQLGAWFSAAGLPAPSLRQLVPWAAFVGAARVAKGRHYFTDVVGGALIGTVVGFIVHTHAGLASMGSPWSLDAVGARSAKTVAAGVVILLWGLYCAVPRCASLLQSGLGAGRGPCLALSGIIYFALGGGIMADLILDGFAFECVP